MNTKEEITMRRILFCAMIILMLGLTTTICNPIVSPGIPFATLAYADDDGGPIEGGGGGGGNCCDPTDDGDGDGGPDEGDDGGGEEEGEGSNF
jgi:hypothetical protein